MTEHVLDFLKGHTGRNTILFLYGDQVPLGREIEFADRVRSAWGIAAHQGGIFRPPRKGGDVAVTIVGSHHHTTTMCGGLSQVFGRFAAEGRFGERVPTHVKEPISSIVLETEAGLVPIDVSVQGGRGGRSLRGWTVWSTSCTRMGCTLWGYAVGMLHQSRCVGVLSQGPALAGSPPG